MAKEKKINVVFFPQKLKREKNSFNTYCRVTYDRKTTMFATNYIIRSENKNEAQKRIDFELENYSDKKPSLNWRKKFIKKLIENEIIRFKENYSVKGFAKRSELYLSSLPWILNTWLYNLLLSELEDKLTYRGYMEFSKICDERYPRTYFGFIEDLKILAKDFNVELKDIIKDYYFNIITASGLLTCFTYDQNKDIEEDLYREKQVESTLHNIKTGEVSSYRFKDRFSHKDWHGGLIEVGSWLLNEFQIKDKFISYIQSDKGMKSLMAYSDGSYLWLKNSLDRKLKYDLDKTTAYIDEMIEIALYKSGE